MHEKSSTRISLPYQRPFSKHDRNRPVGPNIEHRHYGCDGIAVFLSVTGFPGMHPESLATGHDFGQSSRLSLIPGGR
jgi:hypothetical protein